MTDEKKKDQPEDRYRDDPAEFAASADSVQRGSNTTSGGGVESKAEPVTSMSRGSQEDWRADPTAASNDPTHDADHPQSRSDDPGQSSYGGFKDEGPADDENHAADADESAKKDEAHGGMSKVTPSPQAPDDRER